MFHAPSTAPVVPAHPPAQVPPGCRLLPGLVPIVSLALVAAACATTQLEPGIVIPQAVPSPASSLPAFTEPMEITSQNGVLSVTLRTVFRTMHVPQSKTGTDSILTLRTYQVVNANGIDYTDSAKYGFPGPTLRVYPGDSVSIVLQNQMWDTTTATSNPQADTSNTQCASYPASNAGIDSFEDCFHGTNWTNIHFHGMHVTPAPNGDDVLALIPPGATYTYGFRIPANQSPGTHWYHPHKHGSVAIQVLNGMSGALIVDGGPLDTLADQNGMTEHLIALQQIDTLPNLMTPSAFGKDFLVNGKLTPVIVMAPGEVQRWRIVNENVTKTNNFQITIADSAGTEPSFYEVARDGVTYSDTNYAPHGSPRPDPIVLMAPGNRLDLFVQAPQNAGLFSVHAAPVAHSVPQDETRKGLRRAGPRPGPNAAAAATAPAPAPTLFYVQVDTTLPGNNSTLPDTLPPLPSFLANLTGTMNPAQILADPRTAAIVFADSSFGGNTNSTPPAFYLGTVQNPRMKFNSSVTYVPESATGTPLPMILDSVQTWQVLNWSPATNHPFHIHINPFQVIDVFAPNPADPNLPWYAQLDSAAQVRSSPIWLDVVPLPLPLLDTLSVDTAISGNDTTITVQVDTTPGYVLIRQGYEPFLNADGSICTDCGPPTGWFVMHCHILGHEERGMMQVVEIIPTGGSVSPPPPPPSAGTGAGHSHAAPRPGAPPGGHSHH